jgi:AcrR family transcriptional regulator
MQQSSSRGPAREQAILAAALELVAEIGYERVTVDAIAGRAHASKATMYRKWAGKADLVAEALRRRAEGGVTEPPDTGSLRGDFIAAVAAIAATFDGADGHPSLIGLVDALRTDPSLRDLVRGQIDERSRQDGIKICQQAAARGEDVDEARGPTVLGLAVAHLFLRTVLGGTPPAAPERATFVDQILLPLMTKSLDDQVP